MQVDARVGVTLAGLNINDRVGGVGYRTTSLEGWWESSESTGEMVQRVGASGGWLTEAHAGGKRIVHRGSIQSRSHAASEAMLRALQGAVPLRGTVPLAVTDLGQTYHLPIRQEGRPVTDWVTDTLVTFSFQYHSEEYRLLSGDGLAPTRSITVGLPYTEGGRVRPYTLPATIDATTVSGSVALTNPGDQAAPPRVLITFTGPVSRPSVRSAVTGRETRFALDLLPGQALTVDLDHRQVDLGGVPRQGSKRGEWLDPVPGDILVFDAAVYDPAARMTVSWYDARK